MLLFSALSLSRCNLLSPTLPFQLDYIHLISCMHEEKAGFLCHRAASGAGGFQGNAEYRHWRWACWGSGRRTGVHGSAGGSTGISTPLGLCRGCHTSVTSVVDDWCSIFSSVEPHLVAFLRHFFVSLCLLSGFFVFCACELRTGRKDKVLEKGQGLQNYLCFSPSTLSLGLIWRYRGCRGLCPFLLLFLAVQSRPERQGMI